GSLALKNRNSHSSDWRSHGNYKGRVNRTGASQRAAGLTSDTARGETERILLRLFLRWEPNAGGAEQFNVFTPDYF
uniref:Uncharacterized protein n=1 Tax=Monopterus albus TaxID=43700 RepID=A0A3Q3J140_MONAL